jgi:hypothetical protein
MNNLQSDMLLEIVVELHRKHVMETYVDDLVLLIPVIFEEETLDVNRLYQLKETPKIFLCLNN